LASETNNNPILLTLFLKKDLFSTLKSSLLGKKMMTRMEGDRKDRDAATGTDTKKNISTI
jgi:hypothetical protein